MASIRPSIDHTLAVWLVSHLSTSVHNNYGDKIIADQIVDIYSNALNKAGLSSLLGTARPVNPISLADIPQRKLNLEFPLDTELTVEAPRDIKIKANDYLKTFYRTDGVPDKEKNPINEMANKEMMRFYQAQVLALIETNELFTDTITDSPYDKPLKPIDKTIPIGIDHSEL